MEFYLKLDKSKISNDKNYSAYIAFSVGKFKNILLDKLDKDKCAIYDRLLKSQSKLIGIREDYINNDFTYNLLSYSIAHIRHVKTSLCEHYYKIDIPLNNPFGKKILIDKILRILEYGQGQIRPYMIFNEGFTAYKLLITERFNRLF